MKGFTSVTRGSFQRQGFHVRPPTSKFQVYLFLIIAQYEKNPKMFCFKKYISDTCKSPNINNLKQFDYKFYTAITSDIALICKVSASVLVCRIPWVNLGRDSEVWLADPFRQLWRNSSHLLCPPRLEVCRPVLKSSIICCWILGNNLLRRGVIHGCYPPVLDLIPNVGLG